MNCTPESAYSKLRADLETAIDDFKKSMAETPQPVQSEALGFAIAAGLPPKMAYTVSETAKYTGVSIQQIYREHDAGRIEFVIPFGNQKGARIRVKEVDRWMRENAVTC